MNDTTSSLRPHRQHANPACHPLGRRRLHAGGDHDLIFKALALTLFCLLFLTAPAYTSSVSVVIDGIDPDPTWLDESTQLHATAIFTKDGPQWEQATFGWHEEYRWKWEIFPAGAVNSTDPAADGTGSGWSAWSAQSTSTCLITFDIAGLKDVQLTVEARMTDPESGPATEFFTAETDAGLDVLDLEDASHLRLIAKGYDKLTFRWRKSVNPNVAGYKYHFEPDDETLYDVGHANQVTLTGLTSDDPYTIVVHTYDLYGNMTRSIAASATKAKDTDNDQIPDWFEDLLGTDKYDAGEALSQNGFNFDMITIMSEDPVSFLYCDQIPGDYSTLPSIPAGFRLDCDFTSVGGAPSMWATIMVQLYRPPYCTELGWASFDFEYGNIYGNTAPDYGGGNSFMYYPDHEYSVSGVDLYSENAKSVWSKLDTSGLTQLDDKSLVTPGGSATIHLPYDGDLSGGTYTVNEDGTLVTWETT